MSDYTSRKNHEYFAKDCLYGKKPKCTCACPLNLDVPLFIKYLQEGNYTKAYKLFQNQAVFPGVVSRICDEPCKKVCVRKDLDDSIELLLLEQACIDKAKTVIPIKYNLATKNKKIAIIGAGLCGLTCAVKLGVKNYEVTIFEKSDRIGGRLWNLLDPELFLPEFDLHLKNAGCDIKLNLTVNDLTDLDDCHYDAILIATGCSGNAFNLLEGMNDQSFGTRREGVFIAGNLLGTAPVEDIAFGITASFSIEKYLKIAMMDGIPETFRCTESMIQLDTSRVKRQKTVAPQSVERYIENEAQQEAGRCLKCNCTLCSDGCELFDYFDKAPSAIVGDAMASLHTKTSFTGQKATRTLASCNLCGLCGKRCPQDIDMGRFFRDFRYFKTEDHMLPPAFHDFFIRDMEFSNREAYFSNVAPGYQKASYLFFPGCQLGASDPIYIEKTYEYLLEKIADTAILIGCCGAPADWAAETDLNVEVINNLRETWEKFGKPVMIFACPTCKHQFKKFLPEVSSVSLYDIILEWGLPEIRISDKMSIGEMDYIHYGKDNLEACVFDPCSSRYDTSMQKSVRKLSEKAGFHLSELYFSQENAQCCGWGGHIDAANPTLKNLIVQNRISADARPYICYCTNCRDTFVQKGKTCYHILDIIFGLAKENHTPMSMDQRRKNRLLAKKNLMEKVWHIKMIDEKSSDYNIRLAISNEMIEKMNDKRILKEDVCKTIEYCESSESKVLDTETGFLSGHLRIGIITYWVSYIKEEDCFILKNVYTHRIEIIES